MCNYWTWSILDHLKMVKSECLEFMVFDMRNAKLISEASPKDDSCMKETYIYIIYQQPWGIWGQQTPAKKSPESGTVTGAHTNLGSFMLWGTILFGQEHGCLVFLVFVGGKLEDLSFFFGGEGWMTSSKSIDSRFWLQMASALGLARFSSCFRNKTGDDQTSLCIYFFANPLRNFWNTRVLVFVIDQWHALSGDVAPNPNLPLDPFETISLEIGLLSTSTMLFLHQHPLTVNLISLFKNHPIFFWRNGWSTYPPHISHPQGTNISHLQKRKIIFQSDLIVSSMMVVSLNNVDGRNPAN